MRASVRSNRGGEEAGVALVLAMCLALVASVVGASLMLLAQTETYASVNYQSMTQARYAAESGVHGAANFLLNAYAAPVTDAEFNLFNTNVYPVTYNNQPVVLSANPAVSSNYPTSSQQSAFATAGSGSLAIGGSSAGFKASATLLAMQRITDYSTGQPVVIQTWAITSDGTTAGARPATIEVSATMEQQKVSFNMYAFFATNNQCGALSFSGGEFTDSYDSSSLGSPSAWTGGAVGVGVPVTQATNGNVGTNGNLTEGGSSVVHGSLSTPRTGVGKCGSGAVDALTTNGGATVDGGLIQLPQAVSFTTPPAPNPLPPTGNVSLNSCPSGMGATCAACTSAASCGSVATTTGIVLKPSSPTTPISLGDIRLTAGSTLHLTAGIYNVNSITLTGNSTVIIDSGPVVMNIVSGMDLSGGTSQNPSFNPAMFQVLYGGTGTLQVSGNTNSALMVYAPNANIKLTGGSAIYGSVLGATITDTGGTGVHYDRHLPSQFATSWNTMLTSFSWKKS